MREAVPVDKGRRPMLMRTYLLQDTFDNVELVPSDDDLLVSI